jgi:ketosteroid isomerase-like protein
MRKPAFGLFLVLGLVAGCATGPELPGGIDVRVQVADTERAFARAMADRDYTAFTTFLSDEAVFASEPRVLYGKAEIAAAWKPFFAARVAPFSWTPAQVEVLASGTLALSTGPVFDAHGKRIATYTSIWRQEAPGVWRIVFDKGSAVCDCTKP